MPTAHAVQTAGAVPPVSEVNMPTAQPVQPKAPVRVEYVPRPHAVHTAVAPAAAYMPTVHTVHPAEVIAPTRPL